MAQFTKHDWIRGDLVQKDFKLTPEPEDDRSMTSYERELGIFSAKIGEMERQIADARSHMKEVSEDVREIRDFMRDAKAGWKVLTVVSGIGGAVGAALVKFAPILLSLPK